ncbi:MAG: methionine adenosyltransferase [Oligoflexales bacterium]
MSSKYLFTSESVSEGHPDKVADQVSDAVLDELLRGDRFSRVACETVIKKGIVVLAGEVTSKHHVDYDAIARRTIENIGYTSPEVGFDAQGCGVVLLLNEQSPDIAQGVNEGQGLHVDQGAGDQGMMFGYACDETPELMPASISYSHSILRDLSQKRRSGAVNWLRPDAKSQVTIEYENGRPQRVDTVVVSTQHSPDVEHKTLKEYVIEECVKKSIPTEMLKDTKYHINPTGRFIEGGPMSDAGLTGRKIIVDTYGGHGAHGGGAFSGKDPSKVDRSAAYMGRYIAKNLVAAGLASRCLVQLSYAIGVADPVSIYVDTAGTSKHSSDELAMIVREHFRMKPAEISEHLQLLAPIYQATAAYGHFGRSEFPWERTDKADLLRK